MKPFDLKSAATCSADIDHPRPVEALAKAELARTIGRSSLTQAAAAKVFHADRARNFENIKTASKQAVRLFYLGHGGPVDREAVIAGFATSPN